MFISNSRDNYWMLDWLDDYMVGHRGFIAGGCFKDIFKKQKVKDLDIFFENKKDFDDAVKWYSEKSDEYKKRYESSNVIAFENIKSRIVIELNKKIFGKPEEILGQFDFTISKFAYYKEITEPESSDFQNEETQIEYKIMFHPEFFEHLCLNRLVIDDKCPYPMSTFERMFKYGRHGFWPCRETKVKIAKAIHDLPIEQIDVSENLYDGVD